MDLNTIKPQQPICKLDRLVLRLVITEGDETPYRKEVELLTTWCKSNNLLLNVSNTKEIVVNFQRGSTNTQLTIDGAAVERVSRTWG